MIVMIVIISMIMIIVIVYHIFSSGQTLPSDTNQFSRSVRRSSSSSPTTSLRMGSTTTTCQIFSKKKHSARKHQRRNSTWIFTPVFLKSGVPSSFHRSPSWLGKFVRQVRWKNGGGVFFCSYLKTADLEIPKTCSPIPVVVSLDLRGIWSSTHSSYLGRRGPEFQLSMDLFFRENQEKSEALNLIDWWMVSFVGLVYFSRFGTRWVQKPVKNGMK